MQASNSRKALDNQLKAVEKEYVHLTKKNQDMGSALLSIITAMQPTRKAQLAEEASTYLGEVLNMLNLTFALPCR